MANEISNFAKDRPPSHWKGGSTDHHKLHGHRLTEGSQGGAFVEKSAELLAFFLVARYGDGRTFIYSSFCCIQYGEEY